MNFITANHTDIGTVKQTNQDSMLIEQAFTDMGNVLFAAVCDGMGGLAKGELASATLIRMLSDWFMEELPMLIRDGLKSDDLRNSWDRLAKKANKEIFEYGDRHGFALGTTCVIFLTFGNSYFIMNIGDSRAYLLSDQMYQLTKDQSYVQREIEMGNMTPEQAAVSPQRSVLLQCVGASDDIEPDFFAGSIAPNQTYLLCSDGFVHMASAGEVYERLCPAAATDSQTITQNLQYITELIKSRGERDNISALVFRTY